MTTDPNSEPELKANITLDPSQERAVDMMLRARFGVVTGGPGTGKSTTLNVVLNRIDARNLDGGSRIRYALAAPTGRAARRITEVTRREAVTLHRLLGYAPNIGFPSNPDPLLYDLVIVDEASMVDAEVAAALFRSIDTERTRVIFVGDADQLPSVGPGRVLADLVDAGAEVVRLEVVHRAAAQSWVCRNAPLILRGETPELPNDSLALPDFRWYPCTNAERAVKVVVELTSSVMPSRGITDIQVLVPQNTGTAGVESLNIELQRRINPQTRVPDDDEKVWEAKAHEATYQFRVKDRVLHTYNDYELEVFNGEVGYITALTNDAMTVSYGQREISYDATKAKELRLAYALTVHKAQGGEWDWVVVLCHSLHRYMLSRQILYTAVTRAKKGVVLVGDLRGLETALANDQPRQRVTTLSDRLADAFASKE